MNTVEAIILSQIPIGAGIIVIAFELRRMRKQLERALRQGGKK